MVQLQISEDPCTACSIQKYAYGLLMLLQHFMLFDHCILQKASELEQYTMSLVAAECLAAIMLKHKMATVLSCLQFLGTIFSTCIISCLHACLATLCKKQVHVHTYVHVFHDRPSCLHAKSKSIKYAYGCMFYSNWQMACFILSIITHALCCTIVPASLTHNLTHSACEICWRVNHDLQHTTFLQHLLLQPSWSVLVSLAIKKIRDSSTSCSTWPFVVKHSNWQTTNQFWFTQIFRIGPQDEFLIWTHSCHQLMSSSTRVDLCMHVLGLGCCETWNNGIQQ